MLALIFAAAFFVGAPLDAELGKNYATKGFAAACMWSGGEYDPRPVHVIGGGNKELKTWGRPEVPYCTALPAERQARNLIEKVENKIDEVIE